MKMTNTTQTIDFVDNATTKEAGVYAARYAFAFGRGVCKDTNNFAHKWPWLCMGIIAVAMTVVSFILVGSARAERDAAAKRMAHMQEQIEQLSCALEARKEAAR